MKSYKDIVQKLDEVLTKSTPAGEWIHDFVHSDNPKFAGKSAAKRKQMALAAYYAKKNESAAASQNSTAEVDMREAKEEHFVHVSDGSKYDEAPHDKDVEHVKKGAMIHGGKWAGHSDKGAFFKFGSKDDAERFKHHVDKCPHRSCYADLTEAVEYKGIGTDVVDKKKVLNPPIPLTQKKKTVKDFKESIELIAKHEVKADAPHKDGGHVILSKSSNKWHVLHNNKTNPTAKDLHSSKLLHSYTDEKEARAKFKSLKEEAEQIDELSKDTIKSYKDKIQRDVGRAYAIHQDPWKKTSKDDMRKLRNRVKGDERADMRLKEESLDEISKKTLGSYISKAEKEEDKYQQNYTKLRNTRDVTHGKFSDDTPHMTDLDKKAAKRGSGVDLAKQKLAKEEVEQIDELSKHQLLRYIPHAARDVADYVAKSKEHQSAMTSAAHAGSHVAAKDAADKSRASMGKVFKRLGGIDRATRTLARKEIKKEEVEQIEEATVATRKYDWGTMKTVHHGAMFSIPLHPEHHEPIAKLKHGESHSFKDETGRKWKATREHDTVHFHGGSYGTQKTSVPHKSLQESRGHKTLATFFKNREVAQKAFTGQNKPAETPKEPEKKEVKKESVNPALMAILKKRQAAYDAKKAEKDKKKVSESRTPAVHAADPKKTKSTAKEYGKHAGIPGTKRIVVGKADSNEPGNEIKEDMYTSEYKIKYYVDPITGENKTRKIRPHKVNFKASKMRGEPSQQDAQGDYGMKESIKEGFDDYHAIAKELVKRHGKNVDTGHIQDIEGERDSHRPLDRSEVMHHVNKILNSKTVKEDDMPKDEKWTEYKGKTFKKESRMLKFNDYLKEAALSAKQKKIAAIAGDKDKIDADDLAALRAGKKPVDECDYGKMKKEELVGNQYKLDKNKNGKLDADDFKKLRKEEAEETVEGFKPEIADKFPASGVKTHEPKGKYPTMPKDKEKAKGMPANKMSEETEELDEGRMKDLAYDLENMKDHEFHQHYGKAKHEMDPTRFKKPVQPGHEMDRAKALAQRGIASLKKEETEQIDELSKKTLGSYINKAAHDSRMQGHIATDFENMADRARKQSKADSYERLNRKYLGNAWKREAGIAKAVGKLTKEAKDGWSDNDSLAKPISSNQAMAQHSQYFNKVTKLDPKTGEPMKKKDVKEETQIEESYPTKQHFQAIADIIKTHQDPKKRSELAHHHAGVFKGQNPRFDHARFMHACGVHDSSVCEEVSQEMSPYVKGTLAIMDEGKIDNLRDAQKLRQDTMSAYDKDYKPDTSHPHIKVVKGSAYGGANQKDDENDEKPDETKEKRGRGRPAGSKSGARV
mgnify:CR=1 FL=1